MYVFHLSTLLLCMRLRYDIWVGSARADAARPHRPHKPTALTLLLPKYLPPPPPPITLTIKANERGSSRRRRGNPIARSLSGVRVKNDVGGGLCFGVGGGGGDGRAENKAPLSPKLGLSSLPAAIPARKVCSAGEGTRTEGVRRQSSAR